MKIVLIILATMIAAICTGGAHGWFRRESPAPQQQVPGAAEGARSEIKPAAVRELKPIITNLAAPDGAWIRLEMVVVIEPGGGPESEQQIAAFVDDTLSYLRSVTAARLEGVGGLRDLREDLKERSTLRSNGRIREVLIVTMVVQ
jgi:flagellar protein FliL